MSWTTLFDHPLFRLESQHRDGLQAVRIRSTDWVNVVAVTAQGQLVLVRQFRYGIEADSLEVPGGMVEPDEAPVDAAARELREETGYGGGHWQALGFVHSNPAILTNRTWLFLARGVRLLGAPQPDPTESIQVELCPIADIPRLLDDAVITHSLAVVALQRAWMKGLSQPSS